MNCFHWMCSVLPHSCIIPLAWIGAFTFHLFCPSLIRCCCFVFRRNFQSSRWTGMQANASLHSQMQSYVNEERAQSECCLGPSYRNKAGNMINSVAHTLFTWPDLVSQSTTENITEENWLCRLNLVETRSAWSRVWMSPHPSMFAYSCCDRVPEWYEINASQMSDTSFEDSQRYE